MLYRLYPRLVAAYSRVVTWYTCGRHWQAPIDPLAILYIDPTHIDLKTTARLKSEFDHPDPVSEVVAGSWDTLVEPLAEYDLYASFVEHFRDGTPWKQTEFYERSVAELSNGMTKWGCETPSDFEDRLASLDRLHETIIAEGYLTQRELAREDVADPIDRTIHQLWPPELHEVVIDVGRDGELILHDGRHRFTIARILELDSIPVRVKARHEEWQQVRDAVVTQTASVETLRQFGNHPDIRQSIS